MRLRIHGMTCGACVARVESALLSVVGVAQARANLATETATVLAGESRPSTQQLIRAVRDAGYDAETTKAGQETATGQASAQRLQQQRQALFQAVGLALPVIGLEHLAPLVQSTQPGGYVWWRVLQGILCALLLASSAGGPILAGGLRALLHKSPNMDLLVSLGVGVAFLSSVVSLIVPGAAAFYFDAAAMIVGFITAGRYIETRARREAADAVASLACHLPATAVCRRDGKWQSLPIDRVRVGDRVRVAQDTVVPVDGRVVSGSAAVDESTLTGESIPRAVRPDQTVRAGGLVREGMLTVEATAVGAESTVGRILRAVEDAQTGRTAMQRVADRVAGVFVPIVVSLASLTLGGWLIAAGARVDSGWLDGLGWAVRCAVAVLVIACPCA
ncbi:MAG: cation-translocating P-type ATPase, partial [bacterium]|nr:cation-translocating P-type ATPase [bacterium]